MKTIDEYPLCPNCGMKVDVNERFCWWCNEDQSRYKSVCCPECGLPTDMSKRVTNWIVTERKA